MYQWNVSGTYDFFGKEKTDTSVPPEPKPDDRKESECKIRFTGALYHISSLPPPPRGINPQHLLVTLTRRMEYLRRKSDCISIWNTCAAANRFHMPPTSYQPDAANETKTNIFFPSRILAPRLRPGVCGVPLRYLLVPLQFA